MQVEVKVEVEASVEVMKVMVAVGARVGMGWLVAVLTVGVVKEVARGAPQVREEAWARRRACTTSPQNGHALR
jgi:hypothetical protein